MWVNVCAGRLRGSDATWYPSACPGPAQPGARAREFRFLEPQKLCRRAPDNTYKVTPSHSIPEQVMGLNIGGIGKALVGGLTGGLLGGGGAGGAGEAAKMASQFCGQMIMQNFQQMQGMA